MSFSATANVGDRGQKQNWGVIGDAVLIDQNIGYY